MVPSVGLFLTTFFGLYLCAHIFPFSLPPPLFQGNTLSLTISFVSLVVFLNARKMTSQLSGVAGKQKPRNPKLYYSFFYETFSFYLFLRIFIFIIFSRVNLQSAANRKLFFKFCLFKNSLRSWPLQIFQNELYEFSCKIYFT